MSLYCVSDFQMLVGSVLEDSKIDVATINSLDVLSTWPIVCSTINERLQIIVIMRCDNLGYGEVHSDLDRHSQLVQTEIWVRGYDCSS